MSTSLYILNVYVLYSHKKSPLKVPVNLQELGLKVIKETESRLWYNLLSTEVRQITVPLPNNDTFPFKTIQRPNEVLIQCTTQSQLPLSGYLLHVLIVIPQWLSITWKEAILLLLSLWIQNQYGCCWYNILKQNVKLFCLCL